MFETSCVLTHHMWVVPIRLHPPPFSPCCRMHLNALLSQLKADDWIKAQLGLAHSYSRCKVHRSTCQC